MEDLWSVRCLITAVLVVFAVVNCSSGSLAVEDTTRPVSPTNVPIPRQYYGLQRVGIVVAMILGCIIVPLGLLGFLVLLINYCYTSWKKSHAATESSKAPPKEPSDHSSTAPKLSRQTSTFFMYVKPTEAPPKQLKGSNGLY